MLRFHLLSYLCCLAPSLLSLFRVLLSVHLSKTARIARVALFFLVIFVLNPPRRQATPLYPYS